MKNVDLESPSVPSYLGILQGVISRMASNSASCKTWCIALVSAIIVILGDKGKPDYMWISLVPLLLLLCLDAYYLGLEKRFRSRYDDFIEKLHNESATVQDLFIVSLDAGASKSATSTLRAIFSVSVWPFYGLLALMLVAVRVWILRG